MINGIPVYQSPAETYFYFFLPSLDIIGYSFFYASFLSPSEPLELV